MFFLYPKDLQINKEIIRKTDFVAKHIDGCIECCIYLRTSRLSLERCSINIVNLEALIFVWFSSVLLWDSKYWEKKTISESRSIDKLVFHRGRTVNSLCLVESRCFIKSQAAVMQSNGWLLFWSSKEHRVKSRRSFFFFYSKTTLSPWDAYDRSVELDSYSREKQKSRSSIKPSNINHLNVINRSVVVISRDAFIRKDQRNIKFEIA